LQSYSDKVNMARY